MWLEALERLTLSFGRSQLAVPSYVKNQAEPAAVVDSTTIRVLLTAISFPARKSLGRVAVYQERRIGRHARGFSRGTIGKFDFPGPLMLLWYHRKPPIDWKPHEGIHLIVEPLATHLWHPGPEKSRLAVFFPPLFSFSFFSSLFFPSSMSLRRCVVLRNTLAWKRVIA